MAVLKYWDGSAWQTLQVISIPPPTTQYFTASGTWTKDPTAQFVVVECLGGGGAGGSAPAGAVGSHAMGTGGLSGGYARSTLMVTGLGTTEAVTVGAGGNAGAGGNSSFGSWVVANGGPAGTAMGPTNLTYGGASSVFSTTGMVGDLIVPGTVGEMGWGTADHSMGGMGGSSIYGAGGRGAAGAASTASVGSNGIGYGSGGGGSNSNNIASAAQPGGLGAPGLVIVTTFYGTGAASGVTNPTFGDVAITDDLLINGFSAPRGAQPGAAGVSQLTANTTAFITSTTMTAIPGLSVTMTTVAGRRYRLTLSGNLQCTVGADRIAGQFMQDASIVQIMYSLIPSTPAGSASVYFSAVTTITPTAGSHTFTVQMSRSAGTGNSNLVAGATFPTQLIVEDIGVA